MFVRKGDELASQHQAEDEALMKRKGGGAPG